MRGSAPDDFDDDDSPFDKEDIEDMMESFMSGFGGFPGFYSQRGSGGNRGKSKNSIKKETMETEEGVQILVDVSKFDEDLITVEETKPGIISVEAVTLDEKPVEIKEKVDIEVGDIDYSVNNQLLVIDVKEK